jgi:hypothetical protein
MSQRDEECDMDLKANGSIEHYQYFIHFCWAVLNKKMETIVNYIPYLHCILKWEQELHESYIQVDADPHPALMANTMVGSPLIYETVKDVALTLVWITKILESQ